VARIVRQRTVFLGDQIYVRPSGYGCPVTVDAVLDVAGRDLTISSPDKVFFSERRATKLDL